MNYLVVAYDAEGALERRMAVRGEHLANIQKVSEYGHVVLAGGITNDEGNLCGSYLIFDFESKEQLDRYLASEPYITSGVWEKISIDTCKVAIKDDIMLG